MMKMHGLKTLFAASLAAVLAISLLGGSGCMYGGCAPMCSGMIAGGPPPGTAANLGRIPHECCCGAAGHRCVAEIAAVTQYDGILNPGMPVHTDAMHSPEFVYNGAGAERHTALHNRHGPITGKAPSLYILHSAFIC
jgi:hypothetical protein